jgi:hypothetical protein
MAAFIVGGGFGMDFRMPSLPFMNSHPSMNSALEMIPIQIPDLNTLVRRTCLCFEFGSSPFFLWLQISPLLFLTEQQHGFIHDGG